MRKTDRVRRPSLFSVGALKEEEQSRHSDQVKAWPGSETKEFKKAEAEAASERIKEYEAKEKEHKLEREDKSVEAEMRLKEAEMARHQRELDTRLAMATKKEHIHELKREYFAKEHPWISAVETAASDALLKRYNKSFSKHSKRLHVTHYQIRRPAKRRQRYSYADNMELERRARYEMKGKLAKKHKRYPARVIKPRKHSEDNIGSMLRGM